MQMDWRTGWGRAQVLGVALAALVPGLGTAAGQVVTQDYVISRLGTLPIILSAPHGGSSVMAGIVPRVAAAGLTKFVTARDERTAELTELLAAALEREMAGSPFVVIAKFERRIVDANRAAKDAYTPPGDNGPQQIYDAYHRELTAAATDVARIWGHGILIDVHGQGSDALTIFRGTVDGRTVTRLTGQFGPTALHGPQSLFGLLAAAGYTVFPAVGTTVSEDRRYNGGTIVRQYGGGPIDAIQLEFGAGLRAPERLQQTADDTARAVARFAWQFLPRQRLAVTK
jgi:N-formylglutamate amidohydrolase